VATAAQAGRPPCALTRRPLPGAVGRQIGDARADLMHPNGGGPRPQLDVNRDDYYGHGRPDCPDLQRSALFE
jgi:hypothetical protein